MTSVSNPYIARRASADDVIPVLDLGPWRAGETDAADRLADQLRDAQENVGFYVIVNHGVAKARIDTTFEAAQRFHALPLEVKLALKANEHNIGYLPMKGSTTRSSRVHVNTKPNLNEALFIKRDLPPDDPEVLEGKRYKAPNQWPDEALLPGFRADVVAYCDAMEALALSLLPLYARALKLAPTWFDAGFTKPMYTLRMTHYPPVPEPAVEDNQFAIAPHTDSGFLTLLAQSDIPGLAIRLPSGEWIEPPLIPGSYIVNTGDLAHRWTNERFLSTPHRVVHSTPVDRYAIPFFFDCSYDHVMECIPTCTGPDTPPKYAPTTYPEYMLWFGSRNYAHIKPKDGEKVIAV